MIVEQSGGHFPAELMISLPLSMKMVVWHDYLILFQNIFY
jgi:hypothetical protein